MTFAEFATYITVHLWKQGDSVVVDALPQLAKMAEAELNRTLKVTPREKAVVLPVVAHNTILPDDCRSVRNVSDERGGMRYVSPSEFADLEVRPTYRDRSDFTTIGNSLVLPASRPIDPAYPQNVSVWYYSKIPDFFATDSSWVVEDYFDVYIYSVLKHTAPFLREDERIQTWEQMYAAAYGSAMEEDQDRRYAGTPLKQRFSNNIR